MVANVTLLVGAEQSGTTLLRLMLDSHPEIAFAEEFEYTVATIGDDGTLPDIDDFHRYLRQNRAFSTSGFEIDPSLDHRSLVNGFLRSRQARKNAPAVGATMHTDFTKALWLWPDLKMIHLIRDPRDVAPARMAEGLAGNAWHAMDGWLATENEWQRLESVIDPERVLTVRFAELILDCDATLDRICRFIGVDYTAQMLDYARDTDYQEPNTHLAGDWRDSLSTRDVRLVEARVGDHLARLGFEPSGLAPFAVSEQKESVLRWQDRAGRLISRVESFGLRLTVADLLARGLHNQPLQRSLQNRFDRTERALRKKSWSENSKYRTSR